MATKIAKKDESTEVAVPAVASMFEPTTSADLVIPQIRLVAALSDAARNGHAKEGDLILTLGPDDPMPVHLVGGDSSDSVTFYVIGRRKFAATTAGGGLTFQDKRDPSDPDSWDGWFFDVAIPEVDELLPASWMLWRSAGSRAARNLNTMIDRSQAAGNYDPVVVKVSTVERTSRSGHKYFAPAVAPGEPTPGGLTIAREIMSRMTELKSQQRYENSGPKLDQPEL